MILGSLYSSQIEKHDLFGYCKFQLEKLFTYSRKFVTRKREKRCSPELGGAIVGVLHLQFFLARYTRHKLEKHDFIGDCKSDLENFAIIFGRFVTN